VPGDLIVDFGLSLLSDAPDEMDLRAFGSRGVNVYYLYHIGLGEESNFSINPGFGFGMENYNFDNPVTLNYTTANGNEIVEINDYLDEVTLEDIRKTKLSVNYFDIPLEFRFHANKENHDRGFMVAVGGRVGILFDSHTKIKYVADGDTRKIKQKEQFGVSRFRYGLHGRVGFGAVSVFYYQNLSDLFNEDGPEGTMDTSSFMAGISFTLF
jgi:hypothetical protein